MEKELCNLEISVPSASTPVAREISEISKDSLSPEEVRPSTKPGRMCDRRQSKKVKSRILTDSPLRIALNNKHLQRQL
jgi:hypothetical protein